MRTPALATTLLVVLFGLAGCTGAGTSNQAKGTTEGATVGGQVLDEEGLPVMSALVTLANPRNLTPVLQHVTDADGFFGLGFVGKGDWFFTVNLTGYQPYQKVLKVFPNEPQTGLKVILRPIPVPEAFHHTVPGSIHIEYGVAWQIGGDFNQGCIQPSITCNAYSHPRTDAFFSVLDPTLTPLRTIILEETWTSTSPVCAKSIALDVYNPDAPGVNFPSFENPHYWTNYPSSRSTTTNPIVLKIPRDEDGNPDAVNDPKRVERNGGDPLTVRGNWTVRHFPPGKGITNQIADVNCFTDQKFDIYWSTFYLDPAPAAFSGRPA